MNDEELDRFVAERIKQKEAKEKAQAEYARAKAEAEAKELSLIAQDPTKALNTKLNMKVAEFIDSSQEVAEKIGNSAEKLVQKGLEVQENELDSQINKTKKDKNKSEFEVNEDDYRAFGQDTAPEKRWKKKMIEYGNDFWFILLYIVCFFTLAPFYNFTKIIKTQSGVLKFIAVLTGVLMLLACLGGFTYLVLRWCGVW